MKFSVIIPCHNAGRWIGQALVSVASQTVVPHEIIVIDDSSTDDSEEQIKSAGVAVRLLHTEAGNAAVARNVGIEAAQGDFVALLDADDVWHANHLERAAMLFANSNDVALIGHNEFIDAQGHVLPQPPGFKCNLKEPSRNVPAQDFIELLANGFHFGHSTVVYRRQRLLECGLFDTEQKRRHDIDLWLRTIHNHTWTYDSVASIKYRIDTPGSISQDLVKCEYYWLRALQKNAPNFPGVWMDELICTSARRGMGLAFVDGAANDFARMKPLAWPYLRPGFRMFYRSATICPPAFRAFLRWRRRLKWGKIACEFPERRDVTQTANA